MCSKYVQMYSSLNVEKAYFMRGVRISERVRFSHPLLESLENTEFSGLYFFRWAMKWAN